jgi:hypothetical protein
LQPLEFCALTSCERESPSIHYSQCKKKNGQPRCSICNHLVVKYNRCLFNSTRYFLLWKIVPETEFTRPSYPIKNPKNLWIHSNTIALHLDFWLNLALEFSYSEKFSPVFCLLVQKIQFINDFLSYCKKCFRIFLSKL